MQTKINTKNVLVLILCILVLITLGLQFSESFKGDLYYGIASRELPASTDIPNPLPQGISVIQNCDLVVAGGGTGGFAAAVQAARLGIKTCIFEETDWLGGMFTAAGVTAFDGGVKTGLSGGIFGEVRKKLEEKYADNIEETRKCSVSYLCAEPSVAHEAVQEIVRQTSNLSVFYDYKVSRVFRNGNQITGIQATYTKKNLEYIIPARVLIDGTEFGDIIHLAGAQYDLGIDQDENELHGSSIEECIQPLTHVMIIKDFGTPQTIEKPLNYDINNYICSMKNPLCPDAKWTFQDFRRYGQLPDGKVMTNWPNWRWGNDYRFATSTLHDLDTREAVLTAAKNYSLGFLYFLQTQMSKETWGLVNEFNTPDSFPLIPYVRESRRLKGVERVTEADLLPVPGTNRPTLQPDSIAVGDYPIDLHYCKLTGTDFYYAINPFQVPYGAIVPEKIDGLLAIEKNISVSHLANGTTRLQPVVMTIGQSAGIASYLAIRDNIQLRNIDTHELQNILLETGVTLYYYSDLDQQHYSFKPANILALEKIVQGYPDHSFKPAYPIIKAEIFKVIIEYFKIPPVFTSLSPFTDINSGDWFYMSAITALQEEIISGQKFNPQEVVTRAKAAEYIAKAAKLNLIEPAQPSFKDVPTWHPQYVFIETLHDLGIIQGRSVDLYAPDEPFNRGEIVTLLNRIRTSP